MTTWELQEKIHSAIKEKLHVGMTEKEAGEIISEICPDWQGDLISGERTGAIEGGPTDKVIQSGDVVLFDLQVFSEGHWSDLTRVYFMGNPTEKQMTSFSKVCSALSAGEALLAPGTKAKELWIKMRETIDSPNAFDHHGGHCLGTEEIVIWPRFVPECEDVLESGMIVTLEPAIYFSGEFGIRLENNYLITEDGFQRLDNLSLDESEYILKG